MNPHPGLDAFQLPNYVSTAETAVELGCDRLKMPTGIVSDISDSAGYRIVAVWSNNPEFQPGLVFHVGDTYCADVIRSGASLNYPDVAEIPELIQHPVYVQLKLRSYIASPIVVDRKVMGTINFTSTEPRDAFSEDEIRYVEGLAADLAKRWEPTA